jgi:hypothetical protein
MADGAGIDDSAGFTESSSDLGIAAPEAGPTPGPDGDGDSTVVRTAPTAEEPVPSLPWPAAATGLLAVVVLALFALILAAGQSRALASPGPLRVGSPSTMSTDAPAFVSWLRSFKPTPGEVRRNSLGRTGDRPQRFGGCAPALRSAQPA